MPLYTFQCPACGASFDRFLHLSTLKDGATCPSCSAPVAHSSAAASPATAPAPNPSPGEGSCLIPQRG